MVILFYTLLLFYVTWFFFLAVMALASAQRSGRLSPTAHALGLPMLWVGLALDFCTNMVASALFAEFPKEFLLTVRCDRHLHDADGWRKKLAGWLCRNLLDPFQSGGHCH